MLGRRNSPLPVIISNVPWAWKKLSQHIERIRQRSSARRATFGNNSLTSMPLAPCLANFHGVGNALPSGRGLPSNLLVF